jgi:O-antigen ligase
MTEIPVQAAMGWDRPRRRTHEAPRARLRDALPAIAVALLLAIAHIAFGAVHPVVALALSGCFAICAVIALAAAGQRSVTPAMLIGAAVLLLYAATGLAGPLYRAAPHLAGLFAAGCIWTVAYVATRRHGALETAWSVMIWSSAAYCAWLLVNASSAGLGRPLNPVASYFETPANAAVMFGLLTLVGASRVLHVIKQVDADALVGQRLLERLARDAFGGATLLVLALSCLLLVNSRPGTLMTLGILAGLVWWDTLSITTRPHRGGLIRLGVIAAPLGAIVLAVSGLALGLLRDETIAPGIGMSDVNPNLQRLDAYTSVWLESPLTGHGLGSTAAEGAAAQTLQNAKAMLAPGGAHNMFLAWVIEGGLVGLSLLLLSLAAAHIGLARAFGSRRAPRTFARLALAASGLLLLHGITDSSLNLPSAVWLYTFLLGAACGLAPSKRDTTSAA